MMQHLHQNHIHYVSLFKSAIAKSDYAEMKDICTAALQLFPEDPTWHYNMACAFARTGHLNEAVGELAKAVDLGFCDVELLVSDNDIAMLRHDKNFPKILEKAKEYVATPEKNPAIKKPTPIGEAALVTSDNTEWDFEKGGFTVKFTPNSNDTAKSSLKVTLQGKTGDLIRQWQDEGTAAGNAGDLYENHDRNHSVFAIGNFPDFKQIKFCKEAALAGVDTGTSFFNYCGLPVLGNSSTAITEPPFWRSNVRFSQHTFPHMMLLQYLNNQMYVYPQHEDYRANKFGDVFAMRTPYSYIAPGSSWTDQPIMTALAAAMAAFRPETKEALIKHRQLAPALQYITRASLKTVKNREDYLTPLAHPVVIDGNSINTEKMVELAHSITTNCLPPFATFVPKYGVKPYRKNIDFFDNAESEILLVSPCASAFVWRGMEKTRQFILDASSSFDPSGLPLKYHWFIGQGIEDKISISPLNESGSAVRLEIEYHDAPFKGPFNIMTSRADIILVVDNGTHYSPPAFFSYYFLGNEKRTYFSEKLISAVDYSICATNYVDPQISLPKNWCDMYIYDEKGRISGWTRVRKGQPPVSYTANGMRITETDENGKPTKFATPQYETVSPAQSFDAALEIIEK